ncbi:hypothetical protein CHS0354_034166 [Potamilus streckersoni]|uniref:NADH dehydrogenase [ubiquinone] 1 beta subcomplex subunit 8, mitochondrial n=1 Tax=Potamilus streckersoni TaxID=2493646 RepID=A0AAE0RN17_9BIVA|nr:hypothetical protein CHS0354_034166 [Potamilus streckersoni]
MASLRRLELCSRLIKPFLTKSRSVSTSRIFLAEWNKDWKPGPYPKTPEERAAAAKKYNLLPQDYEPFPDDGLGKGDYPNLPIVSEEARDPYENWDMPEYRRNYMEPMHLYQDMTTEDKWNPNAQIPFSYPTMVLTLVGVLTVSFVLFYLTDKYMPIHQYAMSRQYPYNNLYYLKGGQPSQAVPEIKCYTFEPAEK